MFQTTNQMWYTREMVIWLVVGEKPLWKIWVSQLGWWMQPNFEPLWKIWVRQLGWWMQPNINGKIIQMATKPPTRIQMRQFQMMNQDGSCMSLENMNRSQSRLLFAIIYWGNSFVAPNCSPFHRENWCPNLPTSPSQPLVGVWNGFLTGFETGYVSFHHLF